MNKQKGFSTILGIIILLVIGGGAYFYTQRDVEIVETVNTVKDFDEKENTNNGLNNIEKSNDTPVADGLGGAGIVIPNTNDFEISSPVEGEIWVKGDASKLIKWTYPPQLVGSDIHLRISLVNIDLTNQGKDTTESGVLLDLGYWNIQVPVSREGEMSWGVLRIIPETSAYIYSGKSKIVIEVTDLDGQEVYSSASNIFNVSDKVITPTEIQSIMIESPEDNEDYEIKDVLEIKWEGFNNQSDVCQISLVGPLDGNGEVIQSLGAIIPVGGPRCSSESFSWKIESSYIKKGYDYNLIIRDPYNTYLRKIKITD